ncbi:T9SS type A sorting domain-containing protein [bacterium]|nr:T9SS type A sorting domain-containing protein [bacterium]
MKNLVPLLLIIFNFSVFSQNTAPVAVDDTLLIYNDINFMIWPRSNDTDFDGNTIFIDTVFGASNGTVSFTNLIVWYEADTLYSGSDQITCVMCDDGAPSLCDTSTIWITNKQVSYYDNIDINNIDAGINSDGYLFYTGNRPSFNVPKDSATTTIYSGGLWIGGKNAADSNKIYLASEMYQSSGSDFQFGPVMDEQHIFNSEEQWQRTWKITTQEIEIHRWNWWQNGYVTPDPILNWPAHGDVTKGMVENLAPFEDRNNNGIYEPLLGDLPIIKGDQALYFIFNDNKAHTASGSSKMKIEIHGMAYGFNCTDSDALYNTLFIDYTIYNRSQNNYEDTYIGFFIDFDIGGYNDDFIACDVNRSSFYAYNGDNIDESSGGAGYGSSPPAQSCTFLKGPLQDMDGIDNTFGVLNDESVNGLGYGDGVADNERRGIDRFMSVSRNGASCCIDPVNGSEFYNYLTGFWKDGSQLVFGGAGHPNSTGVDTCKFMHPKESDPTNFGTWGVTPNYPFIDGWSEENESNSSGDKRGIGSTGPFTFEPGEIQEITMAFVFADSDTGDQYSSVALMQQYIDEVRAMYLADATPCGNGVFSTLKPLNNEEQQNLVLYPNPASNVLFIKGTSNQELSYEIYDVTGKLVLRGTTNQNAIEVSNLNSGLYFMNFEGRSHRFIKK